jgi:catechol 2,3-dioxygenase-like lactoylglutathione lyase family enzyme
VPNYKKDFLAEVLFLCCKLNVETSAASEKTRHMKVTNILLWVQENKLSEKFYKKLGFDVTASTAGYSEVKLGSFEIVLVNMRDEDEFAGDSLAGEKGRGMYIYVRVEDVDKTYGELLGKGFQPRSEPRDWPWGNREFVLKDPDGYKLCFWQPIH